MKTKQKIVVVSCCFNESRNIINLYSSIEETMETIGNYDWHLLIVDDGSTDDSKMLVTKLILDGKNIEYIQLSRNFGKEAAITAGLDNIQSADACILLDADLQHPIKYLPDLIEKWQSGANMVVAIPEQRNRDLIGIYFSHLYHKIISWGSNSPLILEGGDFRLLDKSTVFELSKIREKTRYMKGLYGFPGGDIQIIQYKEEPRSKGQTKFNFKKRLSLAINGLVSLTTLPIRFFSILGLASIISGFIYLLYILGEIIFYGRSVPGFASILFSIIILNGFIMLQIGVQGEYIAKILDEVKDRPLYVVKDRLISSNVEN